VKIVINNCYGGFGLSKEAVLRYAELRGISLETRKSKYCGMNYYISGEEGDAAFFDEYEIPRTDPALIQVVKELGKKANGQYAALRVVDVPDGISWEIEEYDGIETVAETHRTWR